LAEDDVGAPDANPSYHLAARRQHGRKGRARRAIHLLARALRASKTEPTIAATTDATITASRKRRRADERAGADGAVTRSSCATPIRDSTSLADLGGVVPRGCPITAVQKDAE
jgi:hypothetical protein